MDRILQSGFSPSSHRRIAFTFVAVLDDGAVLEYRYTSKLHNTASSVVVDYSPNTLLKQQRPKGTVDSSRKSCAPLLVENECCIRNVAARSVRLIPPSEFRWEPLIVPASHELLEYRLVELELADDAGGCVQLVDGYFSHFDQDGVVAFPNLVVRVNRSAGNGCGLDGQRANEAGGGVESPDVFFTLRGRSTYRTDDMPWSADVRIPLSHLHGCGLAETGFTMAESMVRRGETASLQAGRGVTSERIGAKSVEELPILVSVPAHECFECLVTFVENIRAFVWPSVVVLHFPLGTAINLTQLALLNRSHPAVHINTQQVDSVVGVRLLHIHGLNVHHVLTRLPHIAFSHALLLASNEMFVRQGVVEYIRRHDFIWMKPPTAMAGALFEHNSNGRRLWMEQQFHEVEDLVGDKPRRWGFVLPDAVYSDHWTAAAMRAKGLTKYPRDTFLLEGTFMNRALAVEFSQEIMDKFPPQSYCEDPMVYPHCEIITPTTFQNVCETRPGIRCGFRVTTMLWKNKEWTAALEDVRRVRCSPFEVPFGFKRVPRDLTNPVRRYIQGLAGDRAIRDSNAFYCFGAAQPRAEEGPG